MKVPPFGQAALRFGSHAPVPSARTARRPRHRPASQPSGLHGRLVDERKGLVPSAHRNRLTAEVRMNSRTELSKSQSPLGIPRPGVINTVQTVRVRNAARPRRPADRQYARERPDAHANPDWRTGLRGTLGGGTVADATSPAKTGLCAWSHALRIRAECPPAGGTSRATARPWSAGSVADS